MELTYTNRNFRLLRTGKIVLDFTRTVFCRNRNGTSNSLPPDYSYCFFPSFLLYLSSINSSRFTSSSIAFLSFFSLSLFQSFSHCHLFYTSLKFTVCLKCCVTSYILLLFVRSFREVHKANRRFRPLYPSYVSFAELSHEF